MNSPVKSYTACKTKNTQEPTRVNCLFFTFFTFYKSTTMSSGQVALIAGVSGIVGYNLATLLLENNFKVEKKSYF